MEEITLEYLTALGVSVETLTDFIDDAKHSEIAIVETPFSALQDSNDLAVTVPVTFGQYSVNFSLRKSLTDSSWWLTDTSDIDNEQRIVMNTFKHHRGAWTYMLVSPYVYDETQTDVLNKQSLASCSILLKY